LIPWRAVLGLGLVALGVVLMLGQAGYVDAGAIISRWWPLVIVVAGVLQLAASRRTPAGPAVVILIGLGLLGLTLGIIPGGISVVWPLILVGIGLWMLLNRTGRWGVGSSDGDIVDSFAVLGDIEIRSHSQGFRGGFMGALFGDVKLDLREAELAPEGANITGTSLFGDLTIRVPEGWRVETGGLPILADIKNEVDEDGERAIGTPVLKIQPLAILSDVVIKH
jgi:hypothetical protein